MFVQRHHTKVVYFSYKSSNGRCGVKVVYYMVILYEEGWQLLLLKISMGKLLLSGNLYSREGEFLLKAFPTPLKIFKLCAYDVECERA